jgi:hypothetical protein
VHAWDIAGLEVGVDVRGTINRPGDRDDGWTVELALPWEVLREASPGRRAPRDGEQWRLNFSRVEWAMDVIDGVYRKRVDPASGKTLPEDNWVWSPQGAIDMHMPERWGVVQFSEAVAGTRPVSIVEDRNDLVTWALRRLYYRQRSYRATHGQYASDLEALRAGDIRMEGVSFKPSLTCHRAAMKSARRGSMAASCTLPGRARVGHAPRGGASPMKPKERRPSLRSY